MAKSIKKKFPIQENSHSQMWGIISRMILILIFCSAGGIIVTGGWLAVQLIFHPEQVTWLNPYLPKWSRFSGVENKTDQSLKNIENQLSQKGFSLGEKKLFIDDENQEYALIPIIKNNVQCKLSCEEIVGIKVYIIIDNDQEQKYYRLQSEINLNSYMDEDSKSLPLTKLIKFDDHAPDTGIWLNVYGQVQDKKTSSYGKIIHYNLKENNLAVILDWHNKNDDLPYWQQVTGDQTPELIISQELGLEPNLQVFQLKSSSFVPNPYQLEEIFISQISILEDKNKEEKEKYEKDYQNGVLLAQNGLWKSAYMVLNSLKTTSIWNGETQSQLDLIKLHADVTESQEYRAWTNVSDQMMANLINCSWSNAILTFQSANIEQKSAIVKIFKDDGYNMSKKIELALQINPNDENLQTLYIMILTSKSGYKKAMSWLDSQKENSAETKKKIQDLSSEIEDIFLVKVNVPIHPGEIVATAEPLLSINPDEWIQPLVNADGSPLPLELAQSESWYQVEISQFYDGKSIRKEPFNDLRVSSIISAQYLWKLLSLDSDPRILITINLADSQKQQSILAVIKAARIKDGKLYVLASGEKLASE